MLFFLDDIYENNPAQMATAKTNNRFQPFPDDLVSDGQIYFNLNEYQLVIFLGSDSFLLLWPGDSINAKIEDAVKEHPDPPIAELDKDVLLWLRKIFRIKT